MLGLVASMVLRCDDCIKYHLGKCREQGVSKEQVYEVFAIANLVGGSICIPHTRPVTFSNWFSKMISSFILNVVIKKNVQCPP